MDTNNIDKLLNILNAELVIYMDVLQLSKKKTDILIEGKVSELENIVKLEQTYVLNVGRLENEREKLIKEIANSSDLDAEKLNISDLVKKVDSTRVEKLTNIQSKITNVIDEIKNLNEMNSQLIKNSLEYINFSINLFSEASTTGENNYGNKGEIHDSKKKNFFDVKL